MGVGLYFKKLDELRFIAFFLVFWQHAFSPSFSNLTGNKILKTIIDTLTITGGIGVHIFFVISGFLITFLMIKEELTKGSISLLFFYTRRILRIWPLYYLILVLGIFVLPNLFNTFKFNGSLIKNLLFLNNFDMENQAPNVGIAWSVAIEEQFYLFWPIIFIIIRNKTLLLIFSIFLFLFSIWYVIEFPSENYFHTFGNIRFLMTGCIGAIFYSQLKKVRPNSFIIKSTTFHFIIFTSLIFIILSPFFKTIYFLSLIGLPLTYILIILILVDNNNDSKTSFCSKMGKYTYGMYLYHPMIIIFIKIIFDLLKFDYANNSLINLFLAIISLTTTIIISTLSYKYFERYVLRFKNKFSFVTTRI
ncbi:MAG: acyltransferase [Chitinophagales bacterium]|nr:acyltransferase [Chitinophagales bacterium]